MENITDDRKKFNRQIINFYAGCQHKRTEQRLDTQSMEYVDYCLGCGNQII